MNSDLTKDELIEKTDLAITELVYPKYDLQKAYNYYNGKRDPEQFKYLEENFGIGSPTSVEFIPLIKKHVDALVGEYLGTPILPKVSCKDLDTINNIEREKQLKISQEVGNYLQTKLKNSIVKYITQGKLEQDVFIEEQLNKLIDDLNTNFISEYEIAAQNVIEYIMQSRNIDMMSKLRQLFIDILVTGWSFYKVKPSATGNNLTIEVYSPLNVFIDRNPDSPYIKDSYRGVVRHWLSKSQILQKYGKLLKKDDLKKIKDQWKNISDTYGSTYVHNLEHHGLHNTSGIYAGQEYEPGYPEYNEYSVWKERLIPVYEVEWIETDDDFIMNRYETIRIGEEIYILKGKDYNVIRTQDDPSYCHLNLNGVFFTNRSATPYSMVMACMPLQDKYDCLHYLRDNLLASSGSVGDIIDVSLLPNWLGSDPIERIKKFLAYKKTGAAIIDSSMSGRMETGQAPMNTIFNGYDDTIKQPAIQAIQLAIDSIEQTTSSITGVFRERLNGIEARDAVTNVKMGQNNSFIITKQYYQQMDLIVAEMLTDSLNCAKRVYSSGLTGTIILGEKLQKIFTALPEHFTITDHDIRIITSTDVIKEMEYLKQVIPDFIKSGSVTPDIIFEAMTTKSLSDLKQKVRIAMKKQKEENNQLQQLQQQNQEIQQQLQDAQKQLQEAQKKVQQLDEQRLKLEQEKLNMQYKVDFFNAKTERDFKKSKAENDTKRTEIEYMQLFDNNPYNDRVKNV